MLFENGGETFVPKKRPRVPYDILRAQQLVHAHPELPRKLKDTMQAVLAHANKQNPLQPITAHRDTLAAMMGVSPKTVTRHLVELANLWGWIELGEQKRVGRVGRFNCGRFSGRTITLTHRALRETELVINSEKDKLSLGYTRTEKETTTKRQRASRDFCEKTRLPKDLVWLHAVKQVSIPGIFKLMSMANRSDKSNAPNGRRLSDIALLNREYIMALGDAKAVVGFLRMMALRETDFAFAAASLRNAAGQAEAERLVASAADSFRRDNAGRSLVTQDGAARFHIEGCGTIARTWEAGRVGSMHLTDATTAKLMAAVKAGRLMWEGGGSGGSSLALTGLSQRCGALL